MDSYHLQTYICIHTYICTYSDMSTMFQSNPNPNDHQAHRTVRTVCLPSNWSCALCWQSRQCVNRVSRKSMASPVRKQQRFSANWKRTLMMRSTSPGNSTIQPRSLTFPLHISLQTEPVVRPLIRPWQNLTTAHCSAGDATNSACRKHPVSSTSFQQVWSLWFLAISVLYIFPSAYLLLGLSNALLFANLTFCYIKGIMLSKQKLNLSLSSDHECCIPKCNLSRGTTSLVIEP